MGKLGDTFKDGRIVGALFAVGALAVVGTGIGVAATAANAEKPAAVQTVEPVDFASLPYTNGLAGEQETDAAAAVAAEQARVAAEAAAAAEAARVAAEQAAAVEAERVAAEQQTVEEEPPADEPTPDDGVPAGAWPLPWIPSPDPVNAPGGGRWDMSNCFGHGETINGVNYCIPS